MRLLLIRHGETPSNVSAILDTRIPGPPLTEKGRAQAEALGAKLAGGTLGIGAIFASVQVRSQETARPLAEALGLELRIREEAREIATGDYEMKSDAVSHEGYHSTIFDWAAGNRDTVMPGGESGHEVFARFNTVVAEAESLGLETVAVVAHGALIRTWVGGTAINVEPSFAAENYLPNTGVVVLTGDSASGWTLSRWVDQPMY